ncbi:hypothetical protein EHS25_009626 [Saitozyma podzolica]|uniref:FAD/NAD(P)-binding domain-containing protein n=1 Tax=Saitozyma podzolica TaxID=1890683 RepID=A0A427YJS7_9TREE|nr:hypothetical protein EHS25_009626 [Saitozyma podzolica]
MLLRHPNALVIPRAARHAHARLFSTTSNILGDKQKLVILGSGWGGYNVARQVDKRLYDVTVVSPNSYFSFTPFLASTTVGTLEYRCATEPVRGIKQVNYAQGWANGIDFARKTVEVEPAIPPPPDFARDIAGKPSQAKQEVYEIGYDKLVIAVGCYSASFGIPGVSKECLEQASLPSVTDDQKRTLLHFAVVGGGPTGVEFAAELHDFIHQDVRRLYPNLADFFSISLYDVAPHILGSFDASLRAYAEQKFARDKVKIKGGSKITAVGPDWLELEGKEKVPYGMLVWSTGLSPNPFIQKLRGVSKDEKTQSLKVGPHLTPIDDETGRPMSDVFAIGDNCMPRDGPKLPATAQVASQMAKYTSKTLGALARGGSLAAIERFHWRNRGSMALVDRSNKSISGFRSRLAGISAWIIWRSYYMTLAMGWRNKILVPMYWTLAFVFGRDVTRF